MGNNSSSQQAQPVISSECKTKVSQNQPAQKPIEINYNNNNNNNNNNNSDNKNAMKEAIKLPHNYEAIIKESDSPINKSSPEKLYEQLRAGIFLCGRRKKYWVNEENINCFILYANALKINCDIIDFDILPKVTWNERTSNFIRQEGVTTAVIGDTFWVEVQGRFHTANLTLGVTYEVAYLIELHENAACGWEDPVSFRLTLPNGSNQERWENLDQSPRDEWVSIPAGTFVASAENFGEIEFTMCAPDQSYKHWKNGLTVKGVAIEPKI